MNDPFLEKKYLSLSIDVVYEARTLLNGARLAHHVVTGALSTIRDVEAPIDVGDNVGIDNDQLNDIVKGLIRPLSSLVDNYRAIAQRVGVLGGVVLDHALEAIEMDALVVSTSVASQSHPAYHSACSR